MARALRDVEDKLQRVPIVTEAGIIKMIAIASGITGAVTASVDQRTRIATLRLSPDHEAAGWSLLQDLYVAEGRLDLWKAWMDHQKAVASARELGQKLDAFPPQYLPAELQRRRKGFVPRKVNWTAPDLAPIVIGADGEVEKATEAEKATTRRTKTLKESAEASAPKDTGA
jgi:hypothetical protein